MLAIAETAGARLINGDRMWHYVEGITNYAPVWPLHGIRILPGPSSVWLDATGKRLPVPLFPGFDTLGTLEHIAATGHGYSWFVLTQKIIEKEFALSGSEQNPDLTGKSIRLLLKRVGKGAPGPVEAFKEKGEDFIVANTLDELIAGMQALSPDVELDAERVRVRDRVARPRDRERRSPRTRRSPRCGRRASTSATGSSASRSRTASSIPAAGPLIAVKLHILTRKSLGGIETDLSSAGARCGRRADPGPVRRGRGERVRRRRCARLPFARGHVPRRLPVQRPRGRSRGRRTLTASARVRLEA